jgi:hypothetical protein
MYQVAVKALGLGFRLLESEIGAAILHRVAAESVDPQARKETHYDTINHFFERIRVDCFRTFVTDDHMSGGDANALLFSTEIPWTGTRRERMLSSTSAS